MIELGQIVISGLGFGGIYALTALGLVLIFNTSSVVNFALGGVAMTVAMIFWTALTVFHLPIVLVWAIALLSALALGAIVNAGIVQRAEHAPLLVQIGLTLGLLLAVEGVAGVIWGYSPKTLPPLVSSSSFAIGPYFVKPNDLVVVSLAIVLGVGLTFFFAQTRTGLAMRAVAKDRQTAALMGIRVRRFVTGAWAAGTAIAATGAILLAPATTLSPDMMDQPIIFAFAAAVFGGFGSIWGAVIGGMAIGVGGNLVARYLSPDYQLTLTFLLIVVVLYVRPQGLLGVRAISRQ